MRSTGFGVERVGMAGDVSEPTQDRSPPRRDHEDFVPLMGKRSRARLRRPVQADIGDGVQRRFVQATYRIFQGLHRPPGPKRLGIGGSAGSRPALSGGRRKPTNSRRRSTRRSWTETPGREAGAGKERTPATGSDVVNKSCAGRRAFCARSILAPPAVRRCFHARGHLRTGPRPGVRNRRDHAWRRERPLAARPGFRRGTPLSRQAATN
jgi:hypothetical protein